MGNPLSKDSSSPRSWASTSPNSSRNVAGSGNKRKSRRRTFGILTTTPSNIFKKNLQKYPFSILLMPSTSNAGKPDISHKSSNQSLSTQQRIMELERYSSSTIAYTMIVMMMVMVMAVMVIDVMLNKKPFENYLAVFIMSTLINLLAAFWKLLLEMAFGA